jgi:signal transduction histidine kinase
MKLTVKLPGIVIAAILVTALASSLLSILIGRSVLRQAAFDENADRVQTYTGAVAFYVESARSLLTATAGLPQMTTTTGPREVAALLLANSDVFEFVMLLTPEGKVAMLEPRALEQGLTDRDMSFQAWVPAVPQASRTVVSDLHISAVTQQPTITIATAVQDGAKRTIGIWAGALKLHHLSATGLGPPLPEGTTTKGASFITDRRGLIIAHQTRPEYVENQTDFSTAPAVQLALAGNQGSGEYFNPIEREQKFAAYRPLPGLGWAVVHYVPASIALSRADVLMWGILSASLALAVLIGGGVFVSIRRTVAPLGRLTRAARTIGTGDFSQRLEISSGDEIGQLAQEFNRMTLAIQKRASELARSNTELEQFAYVASHDLQEPLRMVVGYVQLLERRLADKLDADTLEFMGYAVDGAMRMQTLIEDILAYSRVTTKGQPLAAVDSASALMEALDRLAGQVAEAGAEVKAERLPVVMADRAQLIQLFQNLISNAIKFCKDRPPRVCVEAAHDVGWWRFSVTDNGIGIAPEYRGQLFVIFKRLHTRREYLGTGIGLAICKRIIKRHGGDIGIESAADGGSVFWFTLPEEQNP